MVVSLGLQLEQITLPQDVTTNWAEVMFIHMLQWIQAFMLSTFSEKLRNVETDFSCRSESSKY